MKKAGSWLPAALGGALLSAASLVTGAVPEARADAGGASPKEMLGTQLDDLSGRTPRIAADALGVTALRGEPLAWDPGSVSGGHPGPFETVPIGDDPAVAENEPTVAAKPGYSRRLVAGSHFLDMASTTGLRCVAYTSSDGGESWSEPMAMPQLTPESQCSDPVLAYAPDGRRVYYAYMDIKFDDFEDMTSYDFDIIMSYSDDDGETWTGPVVVLDGERTITAEVDGEEVVQPGFYYDKPWISTPVDRSEKRWVYVSATRFESSAPLGCSIVFTRSHERGVDGSFRPPVVIDSSDGACGEPIVVQGSRPEGGRDGAVLVAWYNSGPDGWLQGAFQIRTRASGDHGASFGPIVTAATDTFEAPFSLGPLGVYHRWWLTMAPDVEIDAYGTAHLVYTHDPDPEPSSPEDGDIRYIRSSGPPYTAWSSPTTISDDPHGLAQGFPALTVEPGWWPTPHVIWEDHRRSLDPPAGTPGSPNLYYDVFYTWKCPGTSSGWAPSVRVTEVPSISDDVFLGDYFDITSNKALLFGIWTDRRDAETSSDLEDDVFGARLGRGHGERALPAWPFP